MDVMDSALLRNRDWDPSYLSTIFDVDFNDNLDLWQSEMDDSELVSVVSHLEKYCPIVEDISIDDNELCSVVESIENE